MVGGCFGFGSEQDFEAAFEFVHAADHLYFVEVGIGVKHGVGEFVFGGEGQEEVFLDSAFGDEEIDLHFALLAHAVGAGDALF